MTKQQAAAELSKVVSESHEVITRATTVFPFTLFPDAVALDRTKLTITHRDFFKVGEVVSFRIEDILHITADVGPFFGSVQIVTRFFDQKKPYRVNFLWRKDALRLKRITQGYIIAMQRQIDCSSLSNAELASLLNQLGKGGDSERV
jgi:hypothetical protein